MRSSIVAVVVSCLLAAATLGAPTVAHAQDGPPALRVTAIPWVSTNGAIPHVTLNGVVTTLKAIAEGGECAGAYRYRWDINGDGDFEDADEGDRNASAGGQYGGFFAPLEATTTFPASPGDRVWLPRVRVWCGEEQATAVYPVLQRVDRICAWGGDRGNGRLAYQCEGDQGERLTRSALADRSIDDGLWYLFKQFSHGADAVNNPRLDEDGNPVLDDGGLPIVDPASVHYCSLAEASPWFATGQAILAAMRRGHNHNPARDGNPYYRHMSQCGLHYQLRSLSRVDVGDRGGQTANADENGYGLQVAAAGRGRVSYQAGTIYEPLAFFGAPEYEAPLGTAEVKGRTLREIGQDGADFLVWGMSNYGAGGDCAEFPEGDGGRWGWEYEPHGTQHIDHSTNGWPSEALRILQRKFGTETYEFAKDRQRCYLKHTCSAAGCVYSAPRIHLAGNGLTSFGWVYDETFDPAHPQMGPTLDALTGGFDTFYGSAYRMYATAKGLRAFSPEIARLPDGRDWHADLVDYLLNSRQADGGWVVDSDRWIVDSVGWGGVTGQYVQILQTWLEAFAYARAEPQLVAPGFPIQLRHDWSYILDPEVDIVMFRWSVEDDPEVEDLNDDGVVSLDEVTWEYETADIGEVIEHVYDIDIGFDELQNFRVVLQVEDSQGRVNYDQDRVQVQVSKVNHAPVAVVTYPEGHQWYRGHAGTTLELDVSGSFDPDADQAPFPGDDPELDDCVADVDCRLAGIEDRVTRILWDLDFDGEFDDAEGPTVDFEIPDGVFEDGERFAVRVLICDDGQWNGQCYDELDGDGNPALDGEGNPVQDCSVCTEADVIIELVGFTPPEISLLGLPELPTDQGVTITLDASGSFDPDDVGGLVWLWDLNEDGQYDDAEGAIIDWILALPPGTHEVGLSVSDAGLQTTTIRQPFEVVNVAPAFDEFAAVGDTFGQGAPIELDVVATDPGTDELATTVHFVPPGGEPTEAIWMDGKYWVPTTATGAYVITGATSDPFDGVADAEITVEVTNVAPEVTRVFSSGPVAEGQSIVFQGWAKDPGGDPLLWSFDVGADGQKEAEGLTDATFVYTPQSSGTFPVEITATDDGGLFGSLRQSFTVSNVPPVILSVFDNGPVGAGEALQIFVNAFDASPIDSLLLEYGFDVGGDGTVEVKGSSPSFSHVFTEPGAHMVVVTVSDGDDTARLEHEVEIAAKKLLSPELIVEGEGNAIVFNVAQLVQDAPEEGEYTWTFGDEGTGEGAQVSHTYADEGTYVVEVSLGGVVVGRATAVITNQPPRFLSLPSAKVKVGVLWSYRPSVEDAGANDKVTVSVEEGPEGMAIAATDDGVVAVQWAPTKEDDGEHRIKLKAADEDGGVSWQEFNLFLSVADDEQAAFESSTVSGGCATAGTAAGGGSSATGGVMLLLMGLMALRRSRQ